MHDSSTVFTRARLRSTLAFVAWGVLLGIAYGQAPLFTSNQNQYFLHGFAQAGYGFLAEDWLANTIDPTPVFTLLVALTARTLPLAAFYLYYFLLFGIYLYSLRRIIDRIYGLERLRVARWIFLAVIFATHSAALRVLLGRGIGGEWQYLFDGGLAGQRLLGTVLQPSTFGVFLLVSVQQFLEDHPYRAVLATAFAATVHPTYLLSAAVLTASYLWITVRRQGSFRPALRLGAPSLALVLPILAYSVRSFFPSGADARDILVHFRLPAHAVPSAWFGAASVVSIGLLGLAIYVARDTGLYPLLLISSVAAASLTAVQILAQSDALALLFPWRLSVYLIPLTVAILAAQIALWIERAVGSRLHRLIPAMSMVIMALSAVSGLSWMALQSIQRGIAPEGALYAYIEATASSGQIYAVPPDMQDFRLETGVPILADFKSIPYRRGEVINWHDRVRLLRWFYRDRIDCGLMQAFTEEYGVTHVVLGPDQLGQTCPEMVERYYDGHYAVYELEG